MLDLACGKGGDLGKWATHPDGIEKYVGSDIAFGSLEHLVERLASECFKRKRTLPTTGHAAFMSIIIPYIGHCFSTESVEKGGRTSWRKIPVKLFEADLGQNDVQVGKAVYAC